MRYLSLVPTLSGLNAMSPPAESTVSALYRTVSVPVAVGSRRSIFSE
jgi:hypothetical protein